MVRGPNAAGVFQQQPHMYSTGTGQSVIISGQKNIGYVNKTNVA